MQPVNKPRLRVLASLRRGVGSRDFISPLISSSLYSTLLLTGILQSTAGPWNRSPLVSYRLPASLGGAPSFNCSFVFSPYAIWAGAWGDSPRRSGKWEAAKRRPRLRACSGRDYKRRTGDLAPDLEKSLFFGESRYGTKPGHSGEQPKHHRSLCLPTCAERH